MITATRTPAINVEEVIKTALFKSRSCDQIMICIGENRSFSDKNTIIIIPAKMGEVDSDNCTVLETEDQDTRDIAEWVTRSVIRSGLQFDTIKMHTADGTPPETWGQSKKIGITISINRPA